MRFKISFIVFLNFFYLFPQPQNQKNTNIQYINQILNELNINFNEKINKNRINKILYHDPVKNISHISINSNIKLPKNLLIINSVLYKYTIITKEDVFIKLILEIQTNNEKEVLKYFSNFRHLDYSYFEQFNEHEWVFSDYKIQLQLPMGQYKKTTTLIVSLNKEIVPPRNQNATEIFNKVSLSVGTVMAFDDKNKIISTGSCVITKIGILSNFHIIEKANKIDVIFNEKSIKINSILKHKTNDLVLFEQKDKLNDNLFDPEIIDFSNLEIGEKTFAIGNPKNLSKSISEGIISGFRTIDQKKYIQTTAAISPGSSGGGLFNSSGQLIGITTMFLKDGQNINFAIPFENNIYKLLFEFDEYKLEEQKVIDSDSEKKQFELEFKLGNYNKAIQLGQKLIRETPNEYILWLNLGTTYCRNNQIQLGIPAFEEALRLHPNDTNIIINLIWSLRAVGNNEKANQYFKQLESISPEKAMDLGKKY